jgi:FKBP-type peptidyl-prolyl cis-trans isomerase FkpA
MRTFLLSLLAMALPAAATAQTPAAPAKPAADPNIIPLPLMPEIPAAQRSCAMRTPSGLGYTILRAGTGAKPAATDTVLVNYIGYLAATGAVFDQNMQTVMPVGDVIAGFGEGLQLAQRTGVVRLCIPAAMGYGDRASGPIPANSDLVFQIELVDFKTAAEIDALRRAQGAEQEAGPEQEAPEGAAPQS